MSKMYVKDPNGKYKLVDKKEEVTPEAKAWVRENLKGPDQGVRRSVAESGENTFPGGEVG